MKKKSPTLLGTKPIGVKNIPTSNLVPNPHNPRVLFDRKPLDVLKESIRNVGILVPLTVYRSAIDNQYVILDGQRRWICAKELGLKEVPANEVAEPNLVQNIVTMFQIHKLREDWELMPTALKLEVLMQELKEKRVRQLAELTGLDPAVVSRCKKLLSYPREYQDRMLDPDPEKRVKADFFIELYVVLSDRCVNKMPWFTRKKFIKRMLEKYQSGTAGIKAVTDFRKIKQYITISRGAQQERSITARLKEFTEDDSLTLDHLIIRSAHVSASARRLLAEVQKLSETIKRLDVKEYYGEEELWKSLEELLKVIRSKILAAGRRLKE